MKLNVYLTILLALLLAACSQNKTEVREAEKTQSETVDIYGKWVDSNQYVNDFFELAVDIPEGWDLTKGSNELVEASLDDFTVDNNEELEEAIENVYTVFWAHRYPVGTQGKTNPNASLMIENVERSPSIESAADYLLAMENTLRLSNKDITFIGQPSLVNIGGLEFWEREITVPVSTIEVRQKHYAMKKGTHILLIGITTISEEDKQIISQLTDTIRRSAN